MRADFAASAVSRHILDKSTDRVEGEKSLYRGTRGGRRVQVPGRQGAEAVRLMGSLAGSRATLRGGKLPGVSLPIIWIRFASIDRNYLGFVLFS